VWSPHKRRRDWTEDIIIWHVYYIVLNSRQDLIVCHTKQYYNVMIVFVYWLVVFNILTEIMISTFFSFEGVYFSLERIALFFHIHFDWTKNSFWIPAYCELVWWRYSNPLFCLVLLEENRNQLECIFWSQYIKLVQFNSISLVAVIAL
jgi:hypothetical protein